MLLLCARIRHWVAVLLRVPRPLCGLLLYLRRTATQCPLLEPLLAMGGHRYRLGTVDTNGVFHPIGANQAAQYQSGSGFCVGKDTVVNVK
jgi:hypothetical protein